MGNDLVDEFLEKLELLKKSTPRDEYPRLLRRYQSLLITRVDLRKELFARHHPADVAMATAANTFVSAARALGVDKGEALRYVEAAFG